MPALTADLLRLNVGTHISVAARFEAPAKPSAVFVFAHGAGAGMEHHFMTSFAAGLHERGVATLRYQFPYMERGSRRVDAPALAHATVRAAVAEARRRMPDVTLLAGGKSYGGRMTSQAASLGALPGVAGLVFVGFPLHSADRPGIERAAHLADVALPMLFLQGTRDELAELELVRGVVRSLGTRAALTELADADHGFHVRALSGGTDALTRTTMFEAFVRWTAALPIPARH